MIIFILTLKTLFNDYCTYLTNDRNNFFIITMFKYVDNIEDVQLLFQQQSICNYYHGWLTVVKREQKYAGGTTRDKEKLRGVILYSQRISDEPRALGSL